MGLLHRIVRSCACIFALGNDQLVPEFLEICESLHVTQGGRGRWSGGPVVCVPGWCECGSTFFFWQGKS